MRYGKKLIEILSPERVKEFKQVIPEWQQILVETWPAPRMKRFKESRAFRLRVRLGCWLFRVLARLDGWRL